MGSKTLHASHTIDLSTQSSPPPKQKILDETLIVACEESYHSLSISVFLGTSAETVLRQNIIDSLQVNSSMAKVCSAAFDASC